MRVVMASECSTAGSGLDGFPEEAACKVRPQVEASLATRRRKRVWGGLQALWELL